MLSFGVPLMSCHRRRSRKFTRSVVTRYVPPYAIVAGVPARIVRMRFSVPVIERLLQSHWWRWPLKCWDSVDPRDFGGFLDVVDSVVETADPMHDNRITAGALLRRIK